jgi:hypothetical protein
LVSIVLPKIQRGHMPVLARSRARSLACWGCFSPLSFRERGGRFDARRQLIVEETNRIDTAYLRLGMLPNAAQPVLRENFRRYLDTRIAVYRSLPDMAAAKQQLIKADNLQVEIWWQAIAAVRADGGAAAGRGRAPARAERDVRHCDDANDGRATPPANGSFCNAFFICLGVRFASGLWHGRLRAQYPALRRSVAALLAGLISILGNLALFAVIFRQ